jgi:hypothetical protein
MKRQRSPSPMPFTAHLEKKRKIETLQLFAGKLISDALLCQIIQYLTVPEHARVTACDKRLQRLGKSERSWARNSTFHVVRMFDDTLTKKTHIADPQKLWNLGCRSIMNMNLAGFEKGKTPQEFLRLNMNLAGFEKGKTPQEFLRFYKRTLRMVNAGSCLWTQIHKCKQLTSLGTDDELSLPTVNKLLRKLPLQKLACDITLEGDEKFQMLNASNLVEAEFHTDLPSPPILIMPPLPKLKRFELNIQGASHIENGSEPIIQEAPVLTDLTVEIEAYADTTSPPLGICLFKSQIGARLKSLNIRLRYGIYRSPEPWETLTDGLLEMPVLEDLTANIMPSRALRAPMLRAAYLAIDNSTGWVNTWMFRDGRAAVPCCKVDSPMLDKGTTVTEARRRWPQASCFIFYKPFYCKMCYAHIPVFGGFCSCVHVCNCG